MDNIIIEVINWEKYNPRNDLKSMNWFRLENKLPEHPAFFELSTNGKWFFVWLMCQCAKNMSGEINLKMSYCTHFSGVSEKEIIKSLQIFHEYDLIRNGHVTDTIENVPNERTNGRTNERNVTNKTNKRTNFYVEQAQLVLFFLNTTTKREYSTNKDIIARLKDGASVADCEAVIAYKHNKWKNTDMYDYMRPSTLFRKSKFEEYLPEAKQYWYEKKQKESA